MAELRHPSFVESIAAAWYAAAEFSDGRALFTAPDEDESAAWHKRSDRCESQAELVMAVVATDNEQTKATA